MLTQHLKHIRKYSLIPLAALMVAPYGYGQEPVNPVEAERKRETQSEVVEFEGFPNLRLMIANDGKFHVSSNVMESDDRKEHGVRIVERGGRYYWASREMTEVSKTVSGVFTTYMALNGSGYVRTGFDGLEELANVFRDEERPTVLYTEHLLNGFTSITYVGLSKAPSVEYILEAERRGILPPEKVAELDAARKLGVLVNEAVKK